MGNKGQRFMLAMLCVGVISLFVVIGWAYLGGLNALESTLQNWEGALMFWRLSVLVAMLAGWPIWINALANGRNWSHDMRIKAIKMRWRIAGLLILIEVVLVQNPILMWHATH
jgi:hypothetical protein